MKFKSNTHHAVWDSVECWYKKYPYNQYIIESLGWSVDESLETHLRFSTFTDDWDTQGMDVYDES